MATIIIIGVTILTQSNVIVSLVNSIILVVFSFRESAKTVRQAVKGRDHGSELPNNP